MFLIAWMPLPVEIREEELFLIDDKEKTGSFKNKRGTEPLSGIVASDMHPNYETKMAFGKITGNGWERKNTVTNNFYSSINSLDILDSEPVGSGEVPLQHSASFQRGSVDVAYQETRRGETFHGQGPRQRPPKKSAAPRPPARRQRQLRLSVLYSFCF